MLSLWGYFTFPSCFMYVKLFVQNAIHRRIFTQVNAIEMFLLVLIIRRVFRFNITCSTECLEITHTKLKFQFPLPLPLPARTNQSPKQLFGNLKLLAAEILVLFSRNSVHSGNRLWEHIFSFSSSFFWLKNIFTFSVDSVKTLYWITNYSSAKRKYTRIKIVLVLLIKGLSDTRFLCSWLLWYKVNSQNRIAYLWKPFGAYLWQWTCTSIYAESILSKILTFDTITKCMRIHAHNG